MRALLVAASVGVIALTGCAPNTHDAEEACSRARTAAWQAEHPDASSDVLIDVALRLSETCSLEAEQDPSGFLAEWG